MCETLLEKAEYLDRIGRAKSAMEALGVDLLRVAGGASSGSHNSF